MNHCPNPIDAALLADYWLAAVSPAEEEDIELHLFSCDGCGARLRDVQAMIEAVGRIARQGSLRMIVSDAYLARLAAAGARVRQYAPPPGGSVECTVTAEDDILIAHLAADLTSAGAVDLCICDATGAEHMRLRDLPVRAGAGAVVYQESIAFAKASPSTTLICRLLARDAAGAERVLGEYTFNHTRSMPGPGAF